MKHEFETGNSKFIFTKDEFGYQEVLSEMATAKKIIIVTYNISAKHTYLIDCLKQASSSAEIQIFTNIPNRWETYFSQSCRGLADKNISVYLTKLRPEYIGERVSVFFNFDNHGKIIMTESVVYIGSANFSEESKHNIEFGFIVRNPDFIQFLLSEIVPAMEEKSVPYYYEYNFMPLLLEANMIMSTIFRLKNELYEQIYFLHDDIDGEWFYYNYNEDSLSGETLDNVMQIIAEANKIPGKIYDAVDTITISNEELLDLIANTWDNLDLLSSKIENLIHSDSIHDLSHFYTNDHINNLLETEYAMDAYEENLEKCIDAASEDAMCILTNLCTNAKDNLDKLLQHISDYQETFKTVVTQIESPNIKKINPSINNT